MVKALGIDYGKRRIGIAISDSAQIIAFPLCAVNTAEIFIFLKELLANDEISCIIVGEPKNLDGSPTDSTKLTADFVAKLTKKYPDISIKSIDERFTSKMAKQSILAAGTKKMKRRDKRVVDKVSAAIILQSFLDSK